jgi:hypothetical protein
MLQAIVPCRILGIGRANGTDFLAGDRPSLVYLFCGRTAAFTKSRSGPHQSCGSLLSIWLTLLFVGDLEEPPRRFSMRLGHNTCASGGIGRDGQPIR